MIILDCSGGGRRGKRELQLELEMVIVFSWEDENIFFIVITILLQHHEVLVRPSRVPCIPTVVVDPGGTFFPDNLSILACNSSFERTRC